MQDKLGFGGSPTYDLYWLSIVMLNVYCLIFVLLFDMHVIILYLSVSMIAHYYLLPRYTLTPTLLILIHDSFYYLIILLVSINFLVNYHVYFTLLSRDELRGVFRSFYRTFSISNLTSGPDSIFHILSYFIFSL